MGRNKEGIPIKCKSKSCGYEWLTKSKAMWVCCPRCMNKTRVPKKDDVVGEC